jgi:hypothetical protein
MDRATNRWTGVSVLGFRIFLECRFYSFLYLQQLLADLNILVRHVNRWTERPIDGRVLRVLWFRVLFRVWGLLMPAAAACRP